MVKFFKNNYSVPFLILIISSITLNIFIAKGEAVLWMNVHHNAIANSLFYYFTILGNAWYYIFIAIFLLLIGIRYSMMAFGSLILIAIAVQSLKHLLNLPRPLAYFGESVQLIQVKDVIIRSYHGFPSGHTATGLSVFYLLALVFKNKILSWVLVLPASLIAISRIYLGQHFLIDVVAGLVLGLVATSLMVNWTEAIIVRKKWQWADKSIQSYFK